MKGVHAIWTWPHLLTDQTIEFRARMNNTIYVNLLAMYTYPWPDLNIEAIWPVNGFRL